MYFYCNVGGTYYRPGASVSAGQYVHLVGTFDGSQVKFYLNGVLKQTVNAAGTLKLPAVACHYLCIGGDSATADIGGANMKGKIGTVNLYSEPLSQSQITQLYNQYK